MEIDPTDDQSDPKKEARGEPEVAPSIQEGLAPSLCEISPIQGEPGVTAPVGTIGNDGVPLKELNPELQAERQLLPTDRPYCGAKRSDGTRCLAHPLKGFTRCRFHGGAAARAASWRRDKENRDKWSNIHAVVQEENMQHLTLYGGPKYTLTENRGSWSSRAKQLEARIQKKVNHLTLGDLREEVAIIACLVEDHLLDLVNPNKHLEDEMRIELTKLVRGACKDLAAILSTYHQLEKEKKGVLTKEKAKAMMLEFVEVFIEYVKTEEEKLACVRRVDAIAKKYL